MSSRNEQPRWSHSLLGFVLFVSLKSHVSASNMSSSLPINSTLIPSSSSVSIDNGSSSSSFIYRPTKAILTQITTSAHVSSVSQSSLSPSPTRTATISVSRNATSTTPKPKLKPIMPSKLSSFGIIMLSIGGALIVVLVVCLTVICCRGRERGPGGTHVPHSNVKMKPWKSAELSTSKELTDDTVDVLDKTNHSQSHHNVGLTNSPQSSPILPAPSANNNSISTPTGTFRNLQTHSPGGDLGDFGRKLSLGRQAYELNATPEESTAEHEPAKEAKGEQDDMTTIHYV